MEVPQKNCMVYNGISFEHGWFRCTPISGNLHMLEKGLKHVAWWMSRWNWWPRGWPARWKHETTVESVHIYVRLFGNHWKPSKTIRNQGNLPIRQRPSRLVASRTWTRWHDDTTTTTTAATTTTTNNNNTNTSNSNSSSSTTAPTVPRWQPWRSTSCWWCRKRRQERRSSCNHAQKCCRSRKCRATESLHMYVKLYGKRLVTVWKYLKPFEDKINQGPLPIPLPIRQQLLSLLEPR